MNFVIISLAVYGLSSLIVEYDGFMGIFKRLRQKFSGSPLTCVICTATWLAVPIILLAHYAGIVFVIPFAIIGVCIVLERFA